MRQLACDCITMFSAAQVQKILEIMQAAHPPHDRPWGGKRNPYHAVIETALSAQSTDAQVDKVTPALFRAYPTPADLGCAKLADVERLIKTVGLYKTKAKNIIAAGKMLSERFHGKVPDTREELMMLPGVGRKTANVVLIKAFGKNAMPVDTHVQRVANRIGLAQAATPEKTEQQLVHIIPHKILGAAHHWIIHYGRTICKARAPLCARCKISPMCRYFQHSIRHSTPAQS